MDRQQVIGWIQEGRLGAEDEVCVGGGYWFYLSETEEVRSQLGIEPPPALLSAAYVQDEITQTQTETDIEAYRDYPELTKIPEDKDSAVQRGKSRVVPVNKGVGAPAPVARKLESTSVWKGIAWALVVIVAVLLIEVFRALQS